MSEYIVENVQIFWLFSNIDESLASNNPSVVRISVLTHNRVNKSKFEPKRHHKSKLFYRLMHMDAHAAWTRLMFIG